MSTILPLITTIVTLIFAAVVFDQFLARRRAYQLVWTVGLVMYLAGTLMEFISGAYGASVPVYRAWYLCGAIFSAAYLGMGTVYLLFPGKPANIMMAILVLGSIYALYLMVTLPVDLSKAFDPQTHRLTGDALPTGAWGVRGLLIALFNTYGTVALIGGAIWSAVAFWRNHIYPHRVVSNILIALGAMMPAIAGPLARTGNASFLYVSELVGVVLIFVGFLRNKEVFGLYRFPLVHGFKRVS